MAAIAIRFSRSTEQGVAHRAGCAGDTCTKRQTQNRDQELALHSSPGTTTGDRRNQAGCRSSPQSDHMDRYALIRSGTNGVKSDDHSVLKFKSRMTAPGFAFTPSELRSLRALKTPAGMQKFL